MTASNIAKLVGDEIIVSDDCLRKLPREMAHEIIVNLGRGRTVWQESDLPSEYFEVLGKTGSGNELRVYRKGKKLCFGSSTNNAAFAEVQFSLSVAPLASYGYRYRYAWVLGFWITLPASNPRVIS